MHVRHPPRISLPHPENGCLKVGFPLGISCMINFRQQGHIAVEAELVVDGARDNLRLLSPANLIQMLLLRHLPKVSGQSEGIILDLGQSFHVARVVCLQQCIALLDDGALILGARAGRRGALSARRTSKLSAGV